MIFNYMIKNIETVLQKLLEHIQITLIAVLIAILVGVPLGILVSRNEKAGKVIMGVANVFQTIPSLALFGFIIPLPIIGSIGYRPAVFVLFLYALLPIIKNTYIGLKNIDSGVIESAKGMGMTSRQIFFMVSLPLAFPIIMGGIRVATVINIGTTTIASLIGAGGLGDFIFRGISMSDTGMILAGAIPTTVLALFVDFILGLIEKKASVSMFAHLITNKKALKRVLAVSLLVIMIGGSIVFMSTYKTSKTIKIGVKNFTESRLLGKILSTYIENNTHYETKVVELGGTLPCFQALKNKDIDMYVEYTGTAYTTILHKKGDIPSAKGVYNVVKDEFQEKYNISWMKSLGFNNTWTLGVTKEISDKYDLRTISDLAKVSDNFIIGGEGEFIERPDGYIGLKEVYGLNFKEAKSLDMGLRYDALLDNKIQVMNPLNTDGRIIELGLVILEDDKKYFPPYYAVPIVNNKTLKKYKDLESLLEKLEGKFTDEEMQNLNYKADVKKQDFSDIANEFLRNKNLIK